MNGPFLFGLASVEDLGIRSWVRSRALGKTASTSLVPLSTSGISLVGKIGLPDRLSDPLLLGTIDEMVRLGRGPMALVMQSAFSSRSPEWSRTREFTKTALSQQSLAVKS